MEYPFDDWAAIYDQVYDYLDHDISFYVQQAMASGGPVLELGCGTGRISLPIGRAGIEVMGVDISPKMITQARRKIAGEPVTFRQGDMQKVRLQQKYRMIIMPFRSFQSILSIEQQIETLATVSEHLAPDGIFVFDTIVPDMFALTIDDNRPSHVRDIPLPDSGHTLVIYAQNDWSMLEQINHTRVIIDEIDRKGDCIKRFYRDFSLRYTFRYEMEHLLYRCGLRPELLYGDFDGGPVTNESEDLVWLAKQTPR
jgi:2-polyprenyl-3-methyl-5-hydroxy-6-metoxy-1,4-benzoquinol methylase